MLFAGAARRRPLQGAGRGPGRARCSPTTCRPARSAASGRCRSCRLRVQLDALADARSACTATRSAAPNTSTRATSLPTGEPIDTASRSARPVERALAGLGEPPGGVGARATPSARASATTRSPTGARLVPRPGVGWLDLQGDGRADPSGVTDLGAGQAASLCQIASEVLGVGLDDIGVYIGDSALNPPAGGTFATRQLYMSGNAVLLAASRGAPRPAGSCRRRSPRHAGPTGCASPTAWWPWPDAFPEAPSLALGDLATMSEPGTACPPPTVATWRAEAGEFDPRTGQGATFPDYTSARTAPRSRSTSRPARSACCAASVATTSGGRSTRYTVEGQIQGAFVQGIGYALTEDFTIVGGVQQATLFADYNIPGAPRLPRHDRQILESAEPGPVGASGIGEPPIGNVRGDHRQRHPRRHRRAADAASR